MENHVKTLTWSYDMEGHAKKCVERFCELANQTTQQQYKVSTPCFDDHQKRIGISGRLVLKYLYLARMGRKHILWSVNKLARADVKSYSMALLGVPHHTSAINVLRQNSSDSRRTPTQRVNGVQCVTRRQFCDTSLL